MQPSETQIVQYVTHLRELLYADEDRAEELPYIFAVFGRVLVKRYADHDLRACTLFHVLSGSSMAVQATRLDFPGDDSIRVFLENLAAERTPEAFAKLKEEFEREHRCEGRS